MENDRLKRGVGGWLAFLIAWMVVLRPLAGAVLLNQMHLAGTQNSAVIENSTWLINTSLFWLVFLVVAALSIYGGLRLWRDRSYASVQAAIWILWITTPIAAVALLISQAYLHGNVTLADAVEKVLINVVVAAVWTLYLTRSGRVALTYNKPGRQ